MKILLAEGHEDTAVVYKLALQDKGHVVVHTTNGEDCLKVYHNEFQIVTFNSNPKEHIQPFDAVILDYSMPRMSGLEVAKEILAVNPHQRIIFASAYLQDKLIYSELKELNVNIDDIKNANLRHEQLREILDILKRGKIK